MFGLGSTGDALAEAASRQGRQVDGFSRSRSLGGGTRVDAEDAAAVRHLSGWLGAKRYHAVVVTLPPQTVCPAFWSLLERLSNRRILLGSTSIYRRIGPGRSRITETTPLKPDHDRLDVESRFLMRGGAVIRLSGIYGGSRNPLRWLKKGRVGYEDRQVNLVHVDDIARALIRICDAPRLQSVYNLADGQEHTWVQIVDRLVEEGLIEHPRRPEPLKREDGFVENRRFLEDFEGFHFRDFWDQLLFMARRDLRMRFPRPC